MCKARWYWLVAATASLAACSNVLGVGDAHLDPTFSDSADAGPSSSGNAGSAGAAAICKHFDNEQRVTKLLPEGGLLPLPGAQ